MAGFNQFRFIPKNMMEWSKWMRDQGLEESLGDPSGSDRILSSNADGDREWVRRFDQWPAQFRGSTNQSLSTSAVSVDLAVTDWDPSVKYGLAEDTISIESDGYYKITYTVYASVDSTAGSADCNVLAHLRKNGAAIDGSYSAAYLSEVSLPDASCEGSVLALLNGGDAIDLRAQLSAAMDVSTVASRCKLIIERVR